MIQNRDEPDIDLDGNPTLMLGRISDNHINRVLEKMFDKNGYQSGYPDIIPYIHFN